MPDTAMPTGPLLALAYLAATAGFGWLALAMEAHWHEVRGRHGGPSAPGARRLRLLGSASLAASLVLCLAADHASMAVLVWIMTLAAATLTVTLLLSWRPRLLRPLALGID